MPVNISGIWLPSGSSSMKVRTVYAESTIGETYRKFINTSTIQMFFLDENLDIESDMYNTTSFSASWIDIEVEGYITCCILNDSSILVPNPKSTSAYMYEYDETRYIDFAIGMNTIGSSLLSYCCELQSRVGTKIDIYYV